MLGMLHLVPKAAGLEIEYGIDYRGGVAGTLGSDCPQREETRNLSADGKDLVSPTKLAAGTARPSELTQNSCADLVVGE
jgi:hypothetical protein